MMKVFIDGSAGTTGLRIRQRLQERKELQLVTLPEEIRKDPGARSDAINGSDIAFFCLPDAAAVEAASFVVSDTVKVIDTSTAHRVNPDWVYGIPELTGQRERIAASRRIANPGCHASGFIALVAPLVENGFIGKGEVLSCFSLTGYSGGGKKMIAQYEDPERSPLLKAPRQYGLTQNHKHLKEMAALCGLEKMPVFCPIVGDFYSGMEVTVTLSAEQVSGKLDQLRDCYRSYYSTGLIRYQEEEDDIGMLSAGALAGKDNMILSAFGNNERMILTARFDNLGKGASGAAIQNMNILLGLPEETGLCL